VVCLANTDGGSIFLGVEDDGTPTGLHQTHLDLRGLPALIANRTVPPVTVAVTRIDASGVPVARIDVPKSPQITATTDGVLKRRRLLQDGRPECVPFLPHEFQQRQAQLGLTDPSSQPVAGATLGDLDPAERARVRQFVERFHGDRSLLELDDEELDGALGLTTRAAAGRVPTVAGLLLIGREAALRDLVPTHEVALQVLDGEQVRFNEFSRAPLLRVFEWLETSFGPLNAEEEVQVGLFRVPVPLVDRRAFREATANALTHRDYARLGAVHVRLEREALVVSNPGGFVEGVSLDNLLTTERRPRNPRLADAFKRIGLVERTGRGVDLIYRGLLRFGRPGPDYSRSTAHSVVLRLPTVSADLDFLRLVLDEEQRLVGAVPIDALIALACLREQRRLTRHELATAIQKTDGVALGTLEALVERGLVAAHGQGRGRTYTLAAQVYARHGQRAEYTRQAGFDRLQQEQMVRAYVRKHGEIRRQDVIDLCRIGSDQAKRLLARLVEERVLAREGTGKSTRYVSGDRA
jgi:ATP-dependent DNA helicase RecG